MTPLDQIREYTVELMRSAHSEAVLAVTRRLHAHVAWNKPPEPEQDLPSAPLQPLPPFEGDDAAVYADVLGIMMAHGWERSTRGRAALAGLHAFLCAWEKLDPDRKVVINTYSRQMPVTLIKTYKGFAVRHNDSIVAGPFATRADAIRAKFFYKAGLK